MRWLSLWLCVILTGQHTLAQETLTNDPRLQTRITVWLKMEPLRDTLRAISKQTGVPLRCQDAIQHYKVSVFVEDRPAGEILTQLAALFRYAWRKDEEGYVLYVPDETRLQEESVLRAGREARVRALQDVIRFAREAVNNPPAEAEDDDSYWNPPQPSEDAPPEEWNRWLAYRCRPWEATREYAQKRGNFPEWIFEDAVLLALLAKMPPQAERALLNGQLVGFSTRPMPEVYPLPESIIASHYMRGYEWDEATNQTRAVQQNPPYWGLWIRLPKRGNYLEYELVGFSCETHPCPKIDDLPKLACIAPPTCLCSTPRRMCATIRGWRSGGPGQRPRRSGRSAFPNALSPSAMTAPSRSSLRMFWIEITRTTSSTAPTYWNGSRGVRAYPSLASRSEQTQLGFGS
jgi:hypothetical protein